MIFICLKDLIITYQAREARLSKLVMFINYELAKYFIRIFISILLHFISIFPKFNYLAQVHRYLPSIYVVNRKSEPC